MANVEGKATAITVVTPVRHGGRFLLALVFWVGRHVTSTLEKLQQLSFIHYARWAVIRRFPDGGSGERLGHTYLFFESNFNGTWDQYIDAFSEVVPTRMKAIWGSSYGFPGPIPVEPFKAYIRKNEYVANHYWSAYPEGHDDRDHLRPAGRRRRSTTSSSARPASTPTRSRPPTAPCSPTSSATCEARAPQPLGPGLRADRADPDHRRRGQRARRPPRHLRPRGRQPAGAARGDPLRALGDHRGRRLRGRPASAATR